MQPGQPPHAYGPLQPQGHGPPTKRGMGTAAKVLIALLVLGATSVGGCLVCAGIGAKGIADADADAKKAAAEGRAKATPIGAGTLIAAYKANEVKADADYKGKWFAVSGRVIDVKKDLADAPYISVGTGAPFELPNVHCALVKGTESRAAGLEKGQSITATGRVDGLMGHVKLKDCDF